ncbi:MAG: hypothetical protein JW846_10465 [Dehalococcoidia bacterium]|nr:hypothetical protein [Dehalococcoidia bacterium]
MMRNTSRYFMASLAALLPLVLLASLLAPGMVSAEGEEATITNRLITSGVAVTSVSTSGSKVTVQYEQAVAEMDSVVTVLQKVGTILSVVAEEMPSASTVVVVQYFDDGQIMQVSGVPSDGAAFMSQQLSAQEFMDLLTFTPLTRGPIVVSGECETGAGEDCSNCDDCPCYPNETCDPGNPQANERGCVPGAAPANSHLVGSQYVCNPGYEWNQDLSACVPVTQCPPHAFAFQGECHCESGYEWNSAGTECVPVQNTSTGNNDSGNTGGGTSDSGGSANDGGSSASGQDVLSKLGDFLGSLVNWLKSLFGG